MKKNMEKEVKHLKRRYTLLKIKWFLLFILPICIILLAYETSRQFLKVRIKEISMDL